MNFLCVKNTYDNQIYAYSSFAASLNLLTDSLRITFNKCLSSRRDLPNDRLPAGTICSQPTCTTTLMFKNSSLKEDRTEFTTGLYKSTIV